MIRKTLLALALVALTGTAFAQASGSMASDAGMAAPAASSAPAKKHHKKHHHKKAAASMASDAGAMSAASDAASH